MPVGVVCTSIYVYVYIYMYLWGLVCIHALALLGGHGLYMLVFIS